MIPPGLVERVLLKLGFHSRPDADLSGLNKIYAAYSHRVPNDNVQKRLWLVGEKSKQVTGGDPIEFFENWLKHGTGGTCFPSNGALCELLNSLGFNARRILGAVLMEGIEHDGNHGTVLVRIGDTDYLADAQLASFSVLPLVAGQPASTGDGIHDLRAVPFERGFEVQWYPGSNRQTPMVTRLDLQRGAVDHGTFLAQYALSALRDRKRSPFNEALFVGRHFPDRILNIGRNTLTIISRDNEVAKREITAAERAQILIEECGLSPEIVGAIPPDEEPGV
ncbi:arylamine N-acetyltransferase [Bradyrhizobium japonicum]|uniref:arylamine N-acetyltransferase n=1 Tax=Bradyrhizobium japonicum TaxID=375 RepID=UPI000576F0CF|nr:arylamine N-acetyltransferase [Bradyrhizobium japonicum]